MEHTPGLFRNPRVLVSSLIALSIVSVAFFSTRTPKESGADALIVKDAIAESIHHDEDSDGLESWEEDLWGTHTENADTDGDGTPDGEEVKVGRDPKKPGPKDRREDVVIATTTAGYYDNDPSLSTTDIISRDLLSGTLALEKGGTLNDKNIDTLISSLIEKARARMVPIPASYLPSDIRVSPSEDLEIYRAYFNDIARIVLESSTTSISEKDIATLWTSQDPSERRAIAAVEIAKQKQFVDRLHVLLVPAALARPHLDLLNALSGNTVVLTRISQEGINPIEDLLYLEEFQTRAEMAKESLETLFASESLLAIPWNETDPMARMAELFPPR